jgi:sodium transport system permease protein
MNDTGRGEPARARSVEDSARIDRAYARIAEVARKEIVDTFRDRRTIAVTLVTAIAAGPVLLLLVLNLVARQADRGHELSLPVAGAERAPALIAFLERQQVKVMPAPSDADERIRNGETDVVLEIDAAFADDVAKGKPATVRLVFDRSRDRARSAIAEVETLLRAYNRQWGRGRLLLRGIANEVGDPLTVESRDLATPQSQGALVLFLIAFYGVFAAVIGGMAAALDTTAGERERASLEPLLTTPVGPLELAIGKWLAVVVLDAAAVTLTLSGFYLMLRFAPLPAVGIPFLFGLAELGRFLVVLVPLIALMPAVLLYVGAHGRTFKEAQSNLSVLLFIVSLIPVIQMFLQKKEPAWVLWIPVSGQYTLLARALRGEALPIEELVRSYAVPLLLAALALVAVARVFSRESVLAGK